MWVIGISLSAAVTGTVAFFVRQEQLGGPATELLADLQQSHHLPAPSGALHLQLVTIVIMVAFQGLDDEVVHWRHRRQYM